MSKAATADMVASDIGHEAQHDLDVRELGRPFGDTPDRDKAKNEFMQTETHAYKTQSIILGGYGKTLTSDELRDGIEGSVGGEMSQWDRNHRKQESNNAEK